ncbi:protein kinase/AAA ATPase/GAF sensor-containing signal transduction histidine kinase [Oleiphilus messinensis]|uniref:histidine kinase n=1 Tax=Oleiphilus messinensis TaxID=141451 RepID=A0A1Y0IC31_9GAMM|nr:AAA family ATPase [Oleiphilus messinensis]ARU58077.1 protein kinase/AAA ATPase/GAF sensor-containing signal transduction histidine kinase [Oleiphilus messinensis]
MFPTLPGYEIKESLYRSARTLVFRGVRSADQCSVVLRTSGAPATIAQYENLSFIQDVLCRFDHPGIIRFIDWIDTPTKPWLVLDDNQGIDLWQYATQFEDKRVPVDILLDLAVQVADALSVIHHENVIHKDLHPGNLIINPETGQLQVIDFGLASILSREQPAVDAPENLEGILAYISPEQTGRMNRTLDYRSDFYTLGVTLYELLCGHPPFKTNDALATIYAHMAVKPTPVTEINGRVPGMLSEIIDKLLNKNAESRYLSAQGLKADLQKCANTLRLLGSISPFQLALNDISDRLHIPQQLYGREEEYTRILHHFEAASRGQPRLLCIKGYPGIGKSKLVNEIYKPVAANHGIFIQGKFNQFQKSEPYSALKLALSDWIDYTVAGNPDDLTQLRERILSRLGHNARVLQDFLGDFSLILGDMPALPELDVQDTQNRLHRVIEVLFEEIAQTCTVVIFIDDLQWADHGTLALLPTLLSNRMATTEAAGSKRKLLILCAYREAEAGLPDSIRQLNDDIAKQDGITDTLTLAPLTIETTTELLSDALLQTRLQVLPLAELVHSKTAGNPFFIKEFVKSLYSQNLINFDLEAKQWRWDLQTIRDQDITENVVDLMLTRMQQLPCATQYLLQTAACIGNRFDVETLQAVMALTERQIFEDLVPAIEAGLIIPKGTFWVPNQVPYAQPPQALTEATALGSGTHPARSHCRFCHDRMQQAAYESMSPEARIKIHHAIGRCYYDLLPSQKSNQLQLFQTVDHLNLGLPCIKAENDRTDLAKLNFEAAKQARDSGVWDTAFAYVDQAVCLYQDIANPDSDELWVSMRLLLVECKFLSHTPEEVTALADSIMHSLERAEDKAQLCLTIANHNLITGQLLVGQGKLIEGLRYLGINIPRQKHELTQSKPELLVKLETCLERQEIKGGYTEETIEHLNTLLPLKLLSRLTYSAYISRNLELQEYTLLKGVLLVYKEGGFRNVPNLMSLFGEFLVREKKYQRAIELAELALDITQNTAQTNERLSTFTTLGIGVWFYGHSMTDTLSLLDKGYRVSQEIGDPIGVACYGIKAIYRYSRGEPLGNVSNHLKQFLRMAEKSGIKLNASMPYRRLVSMLLQDSDEDMFSESSFSTAEWKITHATTLLEALRSVESHWYFWSDQQDKLVEALGKYSEHQTRTWIGAVENRFFRGLTYFRLIREGTYSKEQANAVVQVEGFEAEAQDRYISYFSQLATLCPENYQHMYLLLKAEHGFQTGEDIESVLANYERAIDCASDSERLQYQGLANELYGRFWLCKGSKRIALPHLREAYECYQKWQCKAKCTQLEAEFPDLKAEINQRENRNSTSPLISYEYSSGQQSSPTFYGSLDFASLMKSTQAISKQLSLKELTETLLQTIIENAGAQVAMLVLNTDTPRLQAYINLDKSQREFLQEKPLSEAIDVPKGVLNYVLLSGKTVHLNNAETEGAFTQDPYTQNHRPKSVLCVPFSYREKPRGVLYLENNLSHGAFTQEHLTVIQTLLAQATISFENALLFKEVNDLNTGLEHKVIERTQALNQAVKDLEAANEELKSFSYSVSHDLRAPIRHIRGYSEVLREELGLKVDTATNDLIQRIIDSTTKVNALINGLLELSRMQRRTLDKVDLSLSERVKSVFSEMRERYPEQQVTCHCQPGCWVSADSQMLTSVLDNLIGNAWKYSSHKPQSTITFGQVDNALPIPEGIGNRPDSLPQNQRIYYIQDTGVGFDMAHADQLFGSFKRLHSSREFEGSGIGLATVKRIIEKHGGSIWAAAEENQGATFYFTLPNAHNQI